MNPKDIERLIQQSYETERALPFDEMAWENLSHRLDEEKKTFFGWPFWWGLSTLLSLFAIFFIYNYFTGKIKHAQNQVNFLENQLILIKKENALPCPTDTVFKFVKVPAKFLSKKQQKSPTIPKDQSIQSAPKTPPKPELQIKHKLSSIENIPKINAPALKRLSIENFKVINTFDNKPDVGIGEKIKPKKSSYTAKIGLGYGQFSVHNPGNLASISLMQVNSRQRTYEFMIEFPLSSSFELKIGSGYEDANFQANFLIRDSNGNVDSPPGYALTKIDLQQNALHHSIGFNYKLFKRLPIKPRLGVNLMAWSNRKIETVNTFESLSNYLPPELIETEITDKKAIDIRFITFDASLALPIAKKIEARLSGHYYLNLKETNSLYPKLGLGVSAFYKLN